MAEIPETGSEYEVDALLKRIFAKTRQLQRDQECSLSLQADWLETPVGAVLLAGDDENLHLLGFVTEEAAMIRKLALAQKKLRARIEFGVVAAVARAKRELTEYFAGERRLFETPLAMDGTAFQLKVWEALRQIPFGNMLTYADLAQKIEQPSSFRAVAQACSQNPIAIIVPCHRVINTGGGIGGYSGGPDIKTKLLEFEKKVIESGR